MPIGTSDGEYHEDDIAFERSQFKLNDTKGRNTPAQIYNDTPSDKQRSDDYENGKWFMSGRDSLNYLLKDAPDSPAVSTEEYMRQHNFRDVVDGRKI